MTVVVVRRRFKPAQEGILVRKRGYHPRTFRDDSSDPPHLQPPIAYSHREQDKSRPQNGAVKKRFRKLQGIRVDSHKTPLSFSKERGVCGLMYSHYDVITDPVTDLIVLPSGKTSALHPTMPRPTLHQLAVDSRSCLTSSRRRTFPTVVFGSSSRNST